MAIIRLVSLEDYIRKMKELSRARYDLFYVISPELFEEYKVWLEELEEKKRLIGVDTFLDFIKPRRVLTKPIKVVLVPKVTSRHTHYIELLVDVDVHETLLRIRNEWERLGGTIFLSTCISYGRD